MSLNAHLVETPPQGEFTLENLGLTTDPLNPEGVLGIAPATAPTAVIQTDMQTPGPHNTTLDSQEIAQIPDWNNKVCILTETANKIVDMVEIQKDIEGIGAMSAEKSHVIEATFENFFSSTNPKNSFSQQETQINYQSSRAFMAKKIAVTTEALITQFRDLETNGMSEMAKDIVVATEYCDDELRDIINAAVSKVVAMKPLMADSAVILPFEGDLFIDMLKTDLSAVDLDQIKPGVPLTQEFRDHFEKMKDIWKDPSLKSTFALILEAHGALEGECPNSPVHGVYEGLTIPTIVSLLGKEAYRTWYDQAINASARAKDDLQSAMREVSGELERGHDAHALISRKADVLNNLSKQVTTVQAQSVKFGQFYQSCAEVLVYLMSLR